ncbi:MAG TPA: hypothetical protein VNA20_03510 [Frankiaceae bacterium]|nr:hypothetical protein [Frankiaceae bacterium]
MTIRLALSCAAVLAAAALPAAADLPVCAQVVAGGTTQTCTPFPTTGVCAGDTVMVGTTEAGGFVCVANPVELN